MSKRVELPNKFQAALEPYFFNFFGDLQVGETLSGAIVSISVYAGVDPGPSLVLSGGNSITNGIVTQNLIGGVLGVIYEVTCRGTTSAGRSLIQAGYLAIIPNLP